MSALPLTKTCVNCRKAVRCNPSVGNFALICPYCHLPTDTRMSSDHDTSNIYTNNEKITTNICSDNVRINSSKELLDIISVLRF